MSMISFLRKCSLLLVVVMLFTMLNVSVISADPAVDNENTQNNNNDGETGENPGKSEDGDNGEVIAPSDIDFNADTDGGFEKVASTKKLDLYFDKNEIAIRLDVKDENGNVIKKWRSQLSPKNFRKLDRINDFDKQSMSLITFQYVNLNKPDSQPVWTNVYSERHHAQGNAVKLLDYKNTGAGISFILHFTRLNIKIPVVIEIVDDEMDFRIPNEGFFENMKGIDQIIRARNIIESGLNELQDLSIKLKNEIESAQNNKNISTNEKARLRVTASRLHKFYQDVLKFSESVIMESYTHIDVKSLNELVDSIIKDMPEKYKDRGQRIKELMGICTEQFNFLQDNISYGILELNVMPYFGYGTKESNGYVFYPDGSGAISYYNIRHPENSGRYERYVYYNHSLNMAELQWGQWENYAQLPVWGVKQGDNGFLAIIAEGDFDAKITYLPNSDSYPISRIYSAALYRRQVRMLRNNATAGDAYEVERLAYDRSVKYVFLENDEANYSGMAKKYREYLKENGLLNDVIRDGDKMPFAVDFLMGTKPNSDILVRKTIPMTTYAEAKEILERFRSNGIDGKVYSNLIGWTNAGAYDVWPDPLNPSNALGGLDDLKELTRYARENNIELSLQFDPIRGLKTTMSRRDITKNVVKNSVNVPITDEKTGWYMYSPGFVQKRFEEKQLNKLIKYGANSVGLTTLGQILYYDFNKDFGGSRAETAKKFIEILKFANEKLGSNSVDVGNAYILKYAGRINYAPVKDTGYFFTDEAIPFYQMVVHGNIPYSGGPFNLLYDKDMQKLQFIESGCMPYFYLTVKSPTELRDTRYSNWEGLYSSEVDLWFDKAVEVYKEFDENFSGLWNKTIDKHEIISKGLKKVTYSDGSIIYLNYTNETVVVDDVTLKPVSYVVKGGANS